MQPTNLKELFSALSPPRINAYKSYFGPNLNDLEVFGCYQWNESVSHAFFKLLTLIEVVMRNRMHAALSKHYFGANKSIIQNAKNNQWLTNPYSTLGHQDSCNWYNVTLGNTRLLNNVSLKKIHNITHHPRNGTPLTGNKMPSPDDVVSSLTFGFWSSLVEKCPNIDWDIILKDIFPKHRTSNSNQWTSNIEQQKLSFRLELIRNFRNRLAHHEPIWKFGELLSESRTSVSGQPSTRAVLDGPTTTPAHSIRRLRSVYRKHTELLRWTSEDIYKDYEESTLHRQILWLCSEDGLTAHKERSSNNLESMSPCKFKREISSIIRNKKPALLIKGGRNVAALQHIS